MPVEKRLAIARRCDYQSDRGAVVNAERVGPRAALADRSVVARHSARARRCNGWRTRYPTGSCRQSCSPRPDLLGCTSGSATVAGIAISTQWLFSIACPCCARTRDAISSCGERRARRWVFCPRCRAIETLRGVDTLVVERLHDTLGKRPVIPWYPSGLRKASCSTAAAWSVERTSHARPFSTVHGTWRRRCLGQNFQSITGKCEGSAGGRALALGMPRS